MHFHCINSSPSTVFTASHIFDKLYCYFHLFQSTLKICLDRGSGWRGRWEGGSGWGTHVNPWLFHFNVWQNSLQIKKNNLKKKSILRLILWSMSKDFGKFFSYYCFKFCFLPSLFPSDVPITHILHSLPLFHCSQIFFRNVSLISKYLGTSQLPFCRWFIV